ncbi:hypothetical protein D5R40_29605 [Okeania hirsuta]|uniref:Uncharacterized protein n=1 Tax=Okeania hirsuta TaxID=1458930 RepID=A0A3N6P9G0_9CYAN|nr:hypothetical protein D5R40_29605 [Okeania hirsuta]
MIEHVDRSLGRIMDKLDALGLTENTMVVFSQTMESRQPL